MSRGRVSISQVAESVPFDNSTNGYEADNVQGAIEEGVTSALNTPIYTIVLQHNGTVSDGTWLGYDSLLPGNDTPIIIPRNADFTEFTFSNNNAGADYTLTFRKNSLVATPFYTISKVNTQFFQQSLPTEEPFSAGDQIYIQYGDDGSNASDAVILLGFRAEPV